MPAFVTPAFRGARICSGRNSCGDDNWKVGSPRRADCTAVMHGAAIDMGSSRCRPATHGGEAECGVQASVLVRDGDQARSSVVAVSARLGSCFLIEPYFGARSEEYMINAAGCHGRDDCVSYLTCRSLDPTCRLTFAHHNSPN